jgi:carbon storage regulator
MRRRVGESILIGEDIEIRIIQIGPSRIKIGITAPKSIAVNLKEVKLVREENLVAAQVRSVAAFRSMLQRLVDGPEGGEI